MQLIFSTNSEYRDEIIALYLETFTTGFSQQYIQPDELEKYINRMLQTGYALLEFDNRSLIAALLCCPLREDALFPNDLWTQYAVEKSIYIAELMVSEQMRGKGIGTQLLNGFFETVDKNHFTDVFIRVWNENKAALALYQRLGFTEVVTIEQMKTKPDGKGTFVMKKIYLHKKTN